jgi:hypothetical protein
MACSWKALKGRKGANMTKCCRIAVIVISLATIWIPFALCQQARPTGKAPQEAKTTDLWASYRFLLGDWEATEGSGQPGDGVGGGFTMALDLGDKVMVRHSRADYAPRPGEKAGIAHQDMTIIYQVAGETQLRAFYVDNEGHVIQYLVGSPKEGVAIFETEPAEHGPRFRLDYQQHVDHTISITFSSAAPGGSYRVYTRGTVRRKTGR